MANEIDINKENTQPVLTLDMVKDFLNKDENGRKWFQAETDSRVTKGIKTFEEQTLPKRVSDEIARLHPEETPQEKKLREMEQKLQSIQNEAQTQKLKNVAITEATTRNVPLKLVDFLIGADEETTRNNISLFEQEFKAKSSEIVADKFKENGRAPAQTQDAGTKKYTAAEIAKMDSKTFKALSPNQIQS